MTISHYDLQDTVYKARHMWSETMLFKIYLFITVLLSLAEPVVIGLGSKYFQTQVGILTASSICFFINIFFTIYYLNLSTEYNIPFRKKIKLIKNYIKIYL